MYGFYSFFSISSHILTIDDKFKNQDVMEGLGANCGKLKL